MGLFCSEYCLASHARSNTSEPSDDDKASVDRGAGSFNGVRPNMPVSYAVFPLLSEAAVNFSINPATCLRSPYSEQNRRCLALKSLRDKVCFLGTSDLQLIETSARKKTIHLSR